MSTRGASQRIIKKYGNRRLYDTADSRYVTLDELAQSIRGGAEVRVLDAQSGDDLTQQTLAQIILEGRGASQFLSVPILTQLVRMNDDALADFFGRWMTASMELYQQARAGVQSLVPYTPLGAVPAASNAILRLLGIGLTTPWSGPPGPGYGALPISPHPHDGYAPVAEPPAAPAPPPGETPPAPPPSNDSAALGALKRELDELKAALRGAAQIPPPKAAPKRPAQISKSTKKKAASKKSPSRSG